MNNSFPNPVYVCWSLAALSFWGFAWFSFTCVAPDIAAVWTKAQAVGLQGVILFALLAGVFHKRMRQPEPAPLPLRLLIASVLMYAGALATSALL